MGSARQEEVNAIDNWYRSFDDETTVQLTEEEKEITRQEIWEKIVPTLVVEKKRWSVPMYVKIMARAAVVVGIVCLLVVLAGKLWHTTKPAYATIITHNGEQKTITLQDGSRLMLNAGTTLHVYNDFASVRNIDLVDGEVFVDVRTDTTRPFRIHNGDFTVAVLGTSFNVSAYTGLTKFTVGVVTGKVSVKKDSSTLSVLPKGRQLVYDKAQQTFVTEETSESLLAWRSGRVILNDVSFGEMAVLMKKNFGIDVLTQDNHIKATTYTTELFTTMKPQEAVEVLAAIHQLKIKKINEGFLLYQ